MIRFNYNADSNKVYITFNGDKFYDLLDKIKSIRCCRFNPDTKEWVSGIEKIFPHIESFKEIDETYVVNENLMRNKILSLKESKNTFVSEKKVLNSENIVSPPIKGKSPYENFQLDCINKGIQQNRMALFLGMGSGKSFITITILNQLYSDKEIDKIVIVAPSEGIYNWRRELLKFSNFLKAEHIVICSAKKNRNPFDLDLSKIKILIMTYRHYLTLSDDWYKINKGIKSSNYRSKVIPWEKFGSKRAIILDEVHHIKNHKARQTKVIDLHKDDFNYRYILTGTPTPNNFSEIYSQINFLEPSIINKSYYSWLSEIANIGNKFSAYSLNYVYKEKQKEWEDKFKDIVIRHKSEDILELPDLYIKNIYCELTDIQKKIYEQLINYVITVIKESDDGKLIPRRLVNKFAYISLAYENAELLKNKIDPIYSKKLFDLVNKFDFNKHHGKLDILDSLVDDYINNQNQKITLFDFHPRTLNSLYDRYKKYNPVLIHGQVDHDNELSNNEYREKELERFKKDDKCKLLIGSFRVLSTAINLTECKRVIYFSRDFSYVNWSQSIKRFHRIGQTESVIINPLIFEDSLDLYIEKIIAHKSDLDYNLFNNKESLNKETWKDIFKGKI